jgi:hypothetical protein
MDRLGARALEVLDGKRAPSTRERMGALLTGSPLGLHMHLMHRDQRRKPVDSRSADAEARADQLAWELLAPAAHVAAHLANGAGKELKRLLEERLCCFYGLPPVQARLYAGALLGVPTRAEPWLAALRTSLQS